jgi:hypothetical protein
MSETDRLHFALANLRPSNWEAFEQLVSSYLAHEFPQLRTQAGNNDGGRDAIFFDEPGTVIQFSIQANWEQKIRDTLARLREQGIPCHFLLYASNQDIGAKSANIRARMSAQGIALDVRDIRYFVDRVHDSEATRAAAEDFSKRILDPLLPTSELARNSPVTDAEMRAGLVYLELHLHDSNQARDLTKISYEALVLGALIDSSPEVMLARDEIVAAVQQQLPGQPPDQVRGFVEEALGNLQREKMAIVSGPPEERSYALHHRERSRQANRAIEILVERETVRRELLQLLTAAAAVVEVRLDAPDADLTPLVDVLDGVLQKVLEQEGHRFAEAVRLEEAQFARSELLPIAERAAVTSAELLRRLGLSHEEAVELLLDAALQVFTSPPRMLRAYLRDLADAYTLLAFLRATPDVQRAVSHLFSRGMLVLDASVLLPCLAETMVDLPNQRFTNLLRSATEVGMTLHATAGVANEIDSHLKKALHCFRTPPGAWTGEVPFALGHWRELGGDRDFKKYVAGFRGRNGPDNVQLFLEQGLEVSKVDLTTEADSALPSAERQQFTELWRGRKRIHPGGDSAERDFLLEHDLEMYLGVLGLRHSETQDVFGYESWWVTQDRTAQSIFTAAGRTGIKINSNPCLSPAFLSSLLSLGPARDRLSGDTQLPVALEIQRRGWADMELSSVANQIREEHAEEHEWRIRMRIRDAMNEFKESARG